MGEAYRLTITRHGQTTYNEQGVMNGDPSIGVPLTAAGREQCRAVARALGGEAIDLAIRTRFGRTNESLTLILDGRDVDVVVYPEFDDVRVGEFEGRPVGEYRAWRREHSVDEPPPGESESRIHALYRYVRGYERLLEEEAPRILAVMHDVPIRFLLNALEGADPLDGPVKRVGNAEIHRVGDHELRRALAIMRDRVEG